MSNDRAAGAGESAFEMAARLRSRAERYERGARGEAATAHVLTELGDGWIVIHDVAWPGRKLANIDHVLVGPSGVFVIDSKNWSGRITTAGGVLLRNGRSQTRTTGSAHEAALAVGALLTSVRPEHVVPVLCFTDGDVPDLVIDEVLVCSIVTVVHRLTSRPTVFTEDAVRAVARELERCLPAATAARSATTPKAKARALKRRSPRTAGKAIVGLALAVGLATNPGVFLAVSDGITKLVTDQIAPSESEPTPPPAEIKTKNQKDRKNKQNKQGQR